jgi:UDP-N-acetylglucosamine 2-epimerase (non-hydrolysing)
MSARFFEEFGLAPPARNLAVGSGPHGAQTGQMLAGLETAFAELTPDLVIVYGDTNSTLAGALAAVKMGIPVAHVEAGLRSHDRYSPFPEDLNRTLLSRIAQWHFAPTAHAADLLRSENIDNATIYITGNTVVDALHWMSRHLRHSEIRLGILNGQRKLVLVTCHRRENIGLPMRSVALAIKHLADSHPEAHFLFPMHPNPGVRELIQPILSKQNGVTLCEPLNYEEFLSALHQSYFVISDSGGVQEEATALGKPVLVLRRETERPEGVEAGTLRLVGTDVQEILRAGHELLVNPESHRAMSNGSGVFGDGRAAQKIQKILEQNLTTANRILPFKKPTGELVLME